MPDLMYWTYSEPRDKSHNSSPVPTNPLTRQPAGGMPVSEQGVTGDQCREMSDESRSSWALLACRSFQYSRQDVPFAAVTGGS